MIKTQVCVLIPTLNEEAGIAQVLSQIPKKTLGMIVTPVVVDGNSTDATVKIARAKGAKVIIQQTKGKGAAIAEALEQINSEYLVMADGDGTYDLTRLDEMVKPLMDGKADMTVATRIEDSDAGAITAFNKIGNFAFNRLISFFYGKKITDMLTGYRALKTEKLRDLNLVTKNFEYETEITIEALRNNYRILEFPLHYSLRLGKTKLHPLRDGMRIMKTLTLMVRDTVPLFFFGTLSLAFLLFSLWPVSLVLYEKLSTGSVQHLSSAILAAFSIIVGLQLFLTGMLADSNLQNTKRLENLIKREGKKKKVE